jgi:hypothetical protein
MEALVEGQLSYQSFPTHASSIEFSWSLRHFDLKVWQYFVILSSHLNLFFHQQQLLDFVVK